MGPASGSFSPSLVMEAGMSLDVCSFVESSDRSHLTEFCAAWHRTLTLGVRSGLPFGRIVYVEDDIGGASELLYLQFTEHLCQEYKRAGKTSIKY